MKKVVAKSEDPEALRRVAAIIFENEEGKLLFYLRDDKPTIPFPNHWDFFGGHIDPGETPEVALKREIKEELGFELKDYHFFKEYPCTEGDVYPNIKYIYYGKLSIPESELTLHEGQKLKFFSKDEVPDINFANIQKRIAMDYIKAKISV